MEEDQAVYYRDRHTYTLSTITNRHDTTGGPGCCSSVGGGWEGGG